MKKFLVLIAFLLNIALVPKALGQLGNYWTLQVSTEGTLLSGARVAANSNTAGFFYNPASMASDSSSSFSFNTSLFRTYFLNYKNPFGEGTKLQDIPGNFDPIFLSYFIPRKNKLNVKMGISLMGKQNTNYKLMDRTYLPEYNFPTADTIFGDYEGVYNYLLKSKENWINFSVSKQFNKVLSLGATIVLAYRSLNYVNTINSNYVYENIIGNNSTASFQNTTKAYMYNYKILGKFGAIFNLNEHNRIGLNLTTSSVNIFGRGTIQRSVSQTNIVSLELDTANAQSNDILISDFGSGLKANFKSPFSISLGYNYSDETHKFGFAVEFFREIKPYDVIKGEELETLINTSPFDIKESNFLSLAYGQRDIVNFAIGYSYKLNEKFTILTGFRTNFSTSENVDYSDSYEYNYIQDVILNFYHFTGGSTFTFLRNEFILGVDMGMSFQKDQPNIVNFTSPLVVNDNGVPLQGNIQNNMSISNIMLGFVLGYSFNF